jgi:hypothetical protein
MLTKTGLVKDVQQMKQCVTVADVTLAKRPLELYIKEHKFNFIRLLANSKSDQCTYEGGHKGS